MERILYICPGSCAVTEDGILKEYLEQDPGQQCGDIIGGTVERIMPGIQGAFVKIGRKSAGFLPLRENSKTFAGETLRSGMKIPVQIRKEETGSKGAFLTRDLTLAGRTVLIMPMNRYVGVSSRITAEEDRERMRKTGLEITDGRMGIVMREAALKAEREETAAEAGRLMRVWDSVADRIRNGFDNGTVLYHQDPISLMIEDYEARGISRIIRTESMPEDLQRQLRMASERTVRLRNGGNIVIDRCEAMTVIDVNSGSARADGKNASAYLETNLSACETIAAQIRLRNLGGIILVDFIDMETEEDRNRVEKQLTDSLSLDRRKTVIHGWTKLGIMEMTRKRTGASWEGPQSP